MTDGTSAITTIHFVAMAVLAVLAVIGIVAGMRLKRGRVQAQREVEAHAAEAGVEPDEPAPDDRPDDPAPPAPAPIAPAPPPIADQPVPGTPPGEHRPVADEPAPERPFADEPIVAVAPDGTTAAVAIDPEPQADSWLGDGPLTQIKGLGPRAAARLAELGVDRIGQLAALDEREAQALDAQLGAFTGRMARDRWLEQARLLGAGDRDGFERVFGKL